LAFQIDSLFSIISLTPQKGHIHITPTLPLTDYGKFTHFTDPVIEFSLDSRVFCFVSRYFPMALAAADEI